MDVAPRGEDTSMRLNDSRSDAAGAPAEQTSGETRAGGSRERATPSSQPAISWLPLLAAGLGAGLVSWLGGEATYGAFRPATVMTQMMGLPEPSTTPATRAAADAKNAAVAFAMLGAALGLVLGLAGGLARGSARAAAQAALLGGGLGSLLGAAMAWTLTILDYRFRDPSSHSLLIPLLLHGGIGAAVGAAGGLALGLGLDGRAAAARGAAGGALGALLGAAIYEVIGAIAFPLAETVQTVAVSWTPRLLDRLLIAIPAAATAALAIGDPRARSTPAARTP
jgi:hypothetical protein